MMKLSLALAIVAADLLSACETGHPPERGPYVNAGAGETSLRLAVPCPNAIACGVSPTFQLAKSRGFGWEVGAGYRFNRYLSVQAEGMFSIDGEGSTISPAAAAGVPVLRPKNYMRPALRVDLPVARSASVYVTYGLQLEDLIGSTAFLTGKLVPRKYTTTCNYQTDPNCIVTTTITQESEVGYYDYHHRALRPAATVGFDLFATDTTSLHVEYKPRVNGRIGATTVGASWHW